MSQSAANNLVQNLLSSPAALTMEEPSLPCQGEDTIMEPTEVTPATTAQSAADLRVQLKALNQRFANGVANHEPHDRLEAIQKESIHIAQCIKYLDEMESFCEPTALSASNASSGQTSGTTPIKKSYRIPDGLPMWQWQGNVWEKNSEVAETFEDLLDQFELIVTSNGLDLDAEWHRLLPIKMNQDQRSWFKENLKGRILTWEEIKSILLNTYSTQDMSQVLSLTSEFLSLKMKASESLESFVDKFQRLRRAIKWQDDITSASLFQRALFPSLSREVTRSLINLPLTQQDTVGKIAAKARGIMYTNLCTDEVAAATAKAGKPTSNTLSFVGETHKSIHNPANRQKIGVAADRISFKKKYHCSVHGKGGHSTERCKVYKNLFNPQPVVPRPAPLSSSASSVSSSAASSLCFKCTDNIPWSPAHAAVCKRNKMAKKQYNAPRAIRSARLSLPKDHAHTAPTLDTQESKSSNMEIDLDDLSINYDCKRTISKQNELHTDHSLYVPITIENIETFALVDTGSSISCLDTAFANKNKIKINNNVTGSIILATKNTTSQRVGQTQKALSIVYGDNDDTLIHTSHIFEVLPLSLGSHIIIGLDLLPKLKILITNLAVRHPNRKPVAKVEIDDTPEPNNSPYGTELQQKQFKLAIEKDLKSNAMIPKNSFCTVPESIIRLDTIPNKTAYRAPYPTAVKLIPIVQECIRTWLEDEVIEIAPPNSEWNSPLTLAPKKDLQGNLTGHRPCLDPRLLNSILISNDRQPIPKIDEIFDQLQGAIIFSTLDLRQAFHRFQIYKPHRVKTTFTFMKTQYVFRGCPFGLKHIASRYQRVINSLLVNFPFALAFVDDIIVFSKSYDEHIRHVQAVIKKLTEVNLILNPEKCHFAQQSVYLLGFCIDKNGSSLDPRKVTNALSWPKPSTGKDIQRFLGLVNYFRKYLPKLSDITAPLDRLRLENKLTSKQWGQEQDLAFDKIKKLLSSAPVLYHPDLNHPFYVATDASNYSIGAVLYQVIDKQTRHIGFMARALSKSEKNYSTTKRELLGIIFALKKFHPFLWGNPFTLFTDHRALTYLHTQPVANPMMIQWLDTILDYDFKIIHRPGIQNVLPDKLSRLFENENTLAGDNNVIRITLPTDAMVPAPEERQNLLLKTHLEGHRGAQAIVDTLHSDGIHWKHLKEDALELVKSCPDCQKYNIAKHGYHPLTSIYADAPWDHICIDTAGPLTTSTQGNKYVLLIVDVLTRFCVLKALPDKSSVTIALALRNVLSLFGRPKIIQSDNGTEYVNQLIKKYVTLSGIDHRLITPYHPRSNGIVERWVGKMKSILYKRVQAKGEDWDLYIDSVQEAMNNTPTALHESRPFSLMFAKHPNEFKDYSDVTIPNDHEETRKQLNDRIATFDKTVLPGIREKIKASHLASQVKFNKTHRIIDDIPAGSQVTIKNVDRNSGSEPRYNGYYTVVRKTQGGSYVLKDATGALLARNIAPSQIKVISEEQTEAYEVEAVINHRVVNGETQFRVRWRGYTEEEDTWEPPTHFHDYSPIYKYFERRKIDEPNLLLPNSSNSKRKRNGNNTQRKKKKN